MKVLLQFRFVGDTAKKKKKKKRSLLRGRRTFGAGGGRCCCYCFCSTKIYCFLCTKKVGSISGVNVLAKVQGLTEFLTQCSTYGWWRQERSISGEFYQEDKIVGQSPSSSKITMWGGNTPWIAVLGALIHIWRPEIADGCDISCLFICRRYFHFTLQNEEILN